MFEKTVELGDEVRDKITGFKGIAVVPAFVQLIGKITIFVWVVFLVWVWTSRS